MSVTIQIVYLSFVLHYRRSSVVHNTNKTDHHDITEMLLKVVLSTITLILKIIYKECDR
jgi:hypothetical protein